MLPRIVIVVRSLPAYKLNFLSDRSGLIRNIKQSLLMQVVWLSLDSNNQWDGATLQHSIGYRTHHFLCRSKPITIAYVNLSSSNRKAKDTDYSASDSFWAQSSRYWMTSVLWLSSLKFGSNYRHSSTYNLSLLTVRRVNAVPKTFIWFHADFLQRWKYCPFHKSQFPSTFHLTEKGCLINLSSCHAARSSRKPHIMRTKE